MFCNQCGSEITSEQKFCGKCGVKLTNDKKELTDNAPAKIDPLKKTEAVSTTKVLSKNFRLIVAFLLFLLALGSLIDIIILKGSTIISSICSFLIFSFLGAWIILPNIKTKTPTEKISGIFRIIAGIFLILSIAWYDLPLLLQIVNTGINSIGGFIGFVVGSLIVFALGIWLVSSGVKLLKDNIPQHTTWKK